MPFVRNDKACGHIERCCLARTIRTEQADYLTLTHIYRHVVHDGTLAITLDKPFCTKNGIVLLAYNMLFFHRVSDFPAKLVKKSLIMYRNEKNNLFNAVFFVEIDYFCIAKH